MALKQIDQSLEANKIKAYIQMVRENEKFPIFIFVFLATLLMLSAIPFYPIFLVFLLAIFCAIISYFSPPIATLISFILALPAFIYQSFALGWVFLLVLILVAFEVFEHQLLISILQILIFAPFSFGGLPFGGFFSILGMACASYYFGSKKSVLVAAPSVFLILLLSSLFFVQNTAYFSINLNLYSPDNPLKISRSAVALSELNLIPALFSNFISFESISQLFEGLLVILGQSVILLFKDSGFIQIAGWSVVLFAMSYVSGRLKKNSQTISALLLLLLLPFYYFAGVVSGTSGLSINFTLLILLSIVVLAVAEHFGIKISKEAELEKADRMKAYDKFGFKDVGAASTETLDDVGGYEDVKQELKEAIITPLEKKEIALAYGIKPPSGILLFGPPGTGKTMLMRALAKELKYNFIEVKCANIMSEWYGESEKNVVEVFEKARKMAPAILFFDEIDVIGKKRQKGGTDEVTPRILSTMLQEMDGAVKTKANLIVVGTTNIPNQLDPALLRPGRFDKIIYMHLPDLAARKDILKKLTRKIPLSPDIDFDILAKKTDRFSGADLKNLVTEAKRLAAKEAEMAGKVVPITMEHFLLLLKKIKPSTTFEQLDEYEKFRMDFERSAITKVEEVEEKEVSWKDVAGMEEVKRALLEAIELPLLREDLMKEFKIKPSKGILLFGPPGTGKTLLVKAAANELHVSFQTLSGADLSKEGFYKATSIIKEAFNRARENAPSILFIDEIETFAPARGMGATSDVVGQFLTEMDGIKELKGVVVIAATNMPDLIDKALLRPGRFDKIFYIPPPDENTRKEMFKIHLGEYGEGVNLDAVAKATDGYSGADIASICQSAKMQALRKKLEGVAKPKITTDDLLAIISVRRPSITPSMLRTYELFLEKYGERK
ncbi:MAG: AAA family ATPase [Candidatus Bilamarchaeaceae archaeon]